MGLPGVFNEFVPEGVFGQILVRAKALILNRYRFDMILPLDRLFVVVPAVVIFSEHSMEAFPGGAQF